MAAARPRFWSSVASAQFRLLAQLQIQGIVESETVCPRQTQSYIKIRFRIRIDRQLAQSFEAFPGLFTRDTSPPLSSKQRVSYFKQP